MGDTTQGYLVKLPSGRYVNPDSVEAIDVGPWKGLYGVYVLVSGGAKVIADYDDYEHLAERRISKVAALLASNGRTAEGQP